MDSFLTFFPLNEPEQETLIPQPEFEIEDGMLIRCLLPQKTVTVPAGTTVICENAFSWCDVLETVNLPDSVERIERGAFFGCRGLQTINLSRKTEVHAEAMIRCHAELCCYDDFAIVPEKEIRIKDGVLMKYRGDGKRITLPETVTAIGECAFSGCDTLEALMIPETVSRVGDWAFEGCFNLREIILSHRTTLSEQAMVDCSAALVYSDAAEEVVASTDDFEIEDGVLKKYKGAGGDVVIPKCVTKIKADAFVRCTGLTSVVIPDSVTSIGAYAFFACEKLETIHLSRKTECDKNAFANCPAKLIYVDDDAPTSDDFEIEDGVLKKYKGAGGDVVIPDGVTCIGEAAFEECTSLTAVEIPNSVTDICEYAFNGCTGLTSVVIPNSVMNISDFAFSDCAKLTSVVIPDSVTRIAYDVLGGCTDLTSIVLPDSVTSIEDYAFSSTGLTSIVLPDSVTHIGKYVFSNCTDLKEIHLSRKTKCEKKAFHNCPAKLIYTK